MQTEGASISPVISSSKLAKGERVRRGLTIMEAVCGTGIHPSIVSSGLRIGVSHGLLGNRERCRKLSL